jgi:hypothetical protein
VSSKTGMLTVISPTGTDVYEWNGIQSERDAAKAVFIDRMKTGNYLASAAPTKDAGHREQVRTFDEVEQIEREHGQVTVQISTALVGG